jgi:hypothetical protein
VIETILRHKALWCGTPRVAPLRAPPNTEPAQWLDSVFDKIDLMPDYNDVFMD